MIISQTDIHDMGQRYRVNLINSLSGFKSANIIGTADAEGRTNLSIVSSVFHVGASPPLMGMIMRPHTVVRDTLRNIKENGEYTINHVPTTHFKQAHQTSARYPQNRSEFDACGFSVEKSNSLAAPYVAESLIKIGLIARQVSLIELNSTELVIGEIVELSIAENLISADGYIDIEKGQSVCVSGLDSYHATARLDRLSYAKPDVQVTSILPAQESDS